MVTVLNNTLGVFIGNPGSPISGAERRLASIADDCLPLPDIACLIQSLSTPIRYARVPGFELITSTGKIASQDNPSHYTAVTCQFETLEATSIPHRMQPTKRIRKSRNLHGSRETSSLPVPSSLSQKMGRQVNHPLEHERMRWEMN